MADRNILTASILLLLLGVALDIGWLQHSLPTWVYLVNLLPGSILMIVWILASAVSKPSRQRSIILGLGSSTAILVTLLVGCLTLWETLLISTGPVTNIDQYEEILHRERGARVSHFPARIPDAATHVAFCYRPAWGQGGMSFRLRYQTSVAEIETLLQHYLPLTTQVKKDKILPLVPCQIGENENVTLDLPSDTQFLILDKDTWANGSHGDSAGIAISRKQQIVLYWAGFW